ncbi:coiled-coil domain-containing protein 40 isoform X2 [Drosophila yakuba]|nr:coiled-coil domain-containing protein 40 isoform X2 [Drosophila yakuba]
MSDTEDIDCDFPLIFEPNIEASPEPEEMALLPPNHPLLSKFQDCLRGHLIRTKLDIANEIANIKHHVKLKEQRREEQGLTLYDMQQKMKFQEKQIMELSAVIEKHLKNRQDEEFNTKTLKAVNEEKIKLTKSQKTLYHERMAELEDMQSLGSNIKKWACTVEDEVKNAKRIVSRDSQLQDQLSQEKRKSDILFYRLDIEIKKRENELQSICKEEATMKEVINILNMSIANANTDLEVLQNEHKRLTQAWNEVIIAIQLRDKILFQVQNASRKHREAIKHNIAGIEAIKKQIGKELELNKKLDSFKQRLADETNSLKRECQDENESLLKIQAKLDDLPEFLNTTETDLQEALREGSQLFTEVRKLDLALDKYFTQKFCTEETILSLAQDHLITDKATAYRLKLLSKSQEKRRNVDLSLSKVQNQLSTSMLEVEKLRCVVFNERAYNDSTKTKLKNAENKSFTLENDLKKIHIQIEIKMKLYEKINCKIEEMDHLFGDASGNPTDLKIKQIEKSIHIGELQVREHQQFWIMLQNHFVNLSQKRNDQLNEIQVTRKQLSIIRQKSLKSDQELEISYRKAKELEIFIKKFTSKLELLNDKIYKKRIYHDVEESEFDHEQSEQTQKLKITELKILKLEGKIIELQNEIELYKDFVIDNHRETLSWETKYKMLEETIKWAKKERSVKGEIGLMKTEIHRMNIRYSQLKRAQESLVLDLEHCVMHREQIFVNASVKEHLQTKFKQIKNASQIQQLIDDVNKIERMIYMLRRIQTDLNDIIKEDANIQDRIEEGVLAKHANLEQIIRKQMKAKAYKKLNSLKSQQVILRSELTVQQISQKQSELNYNLTEISKALLLDYPNKKSFLFKVLHVLND